MHRRCHVVSVILKHASAGYSGKPNRFDFKHNKLHQTGNIVRFVSYLQTKKNIEKSPDLCQRRYFSMYCQVLKSFVDFLMRVFELEI